MFMIYYNDAGSVEDIARMLNEGAVGVIPADTVYGISARADEKSAERIYEIKQRPKSKSFIMLTSISLLRKSDLHVPQELYSVWPCPLTAILAGEDGQTHAVRVPDDEFIQALIEKTGPLWSTSCNVSSQPGLMTYDEIVAVFPSSFDFIVRKRDEDVHALPSTMIDCTQRPFRLIRSGAFDVSRII